MRTTKASTLRPIALVLLAACASACDTPDATYAVVDDRYPAVPDGGDTSQELSVYKAWWSVALLSDPVAAGQEGQEHRVVTANDYAYVLLAPGWDPSAVAPPATLIPLRSNAPLFVARGDTLHIAVGDTTMTGNCAAGKPLDQATADFITQRIFPGDFAGVAYDATRCRATATAGDGGADAP
jgi:hypothetical protein